MFSSQFVFWTQNDTKQECAKSAKSCAQMNEKVFQSYLKTERAVLQQLVDLSNTELQKKEEKEENDLKEEDLSECTFKPKINHTHVKDFNFANQTFV